MVLTTTKKDVSSFLFDFWRLGRLRCSGAPPGGSQQNRAEDLMFHALSVEGGTGSGLMEAGLHAGRQAGSMRWCSNHAVPHFPPRASSLFFLIGIQMVS